MRRTGVFAVAVMIGAAMVAVSLTTVRAQQGQQGRTVNDGVYAAEQATRGETVYTDQCAACHDPQLTGGVGPALAGAEFVASWKGRTVADFFDQIKMTMPLTSPGTLTPEQTADVIAFIFSSNKFPAGSAALPADLEALKAIAMAEPSGAAPATTSGAAAPAGGAGLYSADQAKRGEGLYTDQCAACHGADLTGGVGPALAGADFAATWTGKSVGELFELVATTMPLTAPGTLMPQQTADVIAYVLSVNKYPAGATELAADPTTLKAVTLSEPPK